MANYTAADIKKLREETDAPMLECKMALEEADGDFDKAKQLLREKGKAAAAKRADRSTAEGVVAFAGAADGKTVGGVVLECETDFVAKNESFIEVAQKLAEIMRDNDPGDDPLSIVSGGESVKDMVEAAVAKIRENIKVTKAVRLVSDGAVEFYVHHDRTKGAAIVVDGPGGEAVRKVAIQVVAFPPEVLTKAELSQDRLASEIESEVKRAINEGKDENIARKVAEGRVNKEFVKEVVLMEQPFYAEPSKSVAQYLAENAKDTKVKSFVYLRVGGK